ncbi:roundabout homolog 1 isoform X1 [Rhinichthys klamathensis goyatoka]|uniref:roundabout homolog 1 isoform X1 n=1 Tax=Rhinichthys klamathensis goyatoka TaxID=3034132 RepID=UPI0024B528B1|nr:roundabout homolog 1 isoform X1 [Rhinichthys klamathensis goyatoka]
MQVSAWLLWVAWLCTWTEAARHCQCQCACLPDEQVAQRSERSEGRGHLRHRLAHQRASHRERAHRRKGSRLVSDSGLPRIVHHPSDVVVRVGSPATLSCRAEGNPEPTIEWLRNGQPLDISKMDAQSQPIVLPEGSLFFFSVVPGRKSQSHEAVYACVARNSVGIATSRNASLHIAALREDFRVQPSGVEVVVGEVAVMDCSPPVGHPEPNVTWRKDGIPINSSNEHYSELNGKLIIAPAQKNDSGVYSCIASNIVGVRESRAARLSVLAKPMLLRKPEDVSVQLGESAQFFCEADGDPMPSVEWSRDQGPLPNGRYLINPDHSLQIHYVTAQDMGRYTCTAENKLGVSVASAQLLVEDTGSTRLRDLHKELSALRVSLENVTVMSTASNMSQVMWRLQSSMSQPHYLEGFEVLYRSLLPASSEWTAQRVPQPGLHTHVGPLKRGYKYEFKVRPYGGSLYGRESNTRHLRVPEIVPSAPPQDVSITMPTDRNDTAHLSWDPPPHDAHNGIIQGYQVWCVESEELKSFNWTVDSGTHSIEISTLQPGRLYWVTVTAVNGAGVGVQSDPYKLLIESRQESAPHQTGILSMSHFLAVIKEPVFIGSAGTLLWCVLMITALFLYRRHVRPANLGGKSSGLYRLESEDLIIKHRMAAPDSPWISGGWRPDSSSEPKQGLWTHKQDNSGFRRTTLPITAKKEPNPLRSAVPIVPDNCGVYGTFYVDLTGNGLKTFNSPGRCPRMPHGNSQLHNSETVRITEPIVKTAVVREVQALPWKRALPSQPNMGVLKESWEKNYKRELHTVKSAPLMPVNQHALAVCSGPNNHQQRFSQHPAGGVSEHVKLPSSPRILHYSTSLQLVDMLPSPPPLPVEDNHSLSSEDESTRSTKLTVDIGSQQSVCAASGLQGFTMSTTSCPTHHSPAQLSPSYSHLSTASFCLSTDDYQDTTLSTQGHTQYMEISPKPQGPSSPSMPRPFSPTPTFGYICGPVDQEMDDEQGCQPIGLRGATLRSTPSSCYSEWEGSLWNGWGSVSESNVASARTSIISSSDCSFINDANFARVLALTAESMSGTLSDFSPPASPLSVLFPPRECFGELEPLPVWDWSTAWVEELEAQFKASRETRRTATSSRHSGIEHWRGHLETPSHR